MLIAILNADTPELPLETVEVPDAIAKDFENVKHICTDLGNIYGIYPYEDEENDG